MCTKQGKELFSLQFSLHIGVETYRKVEIWPQEKGEDNLWDFERIPCALCFFFSVFVALL